MKLKKILMGILFPSLLISCTPKGEQINENYIDDLKGYGYITYSKDHHIDIKVKMYDYTLTSTNGSGDVYIAYDDVELQDARYNHEGDDIPHVDGELMLVASKSKKNETVVVPSFLTYGDSACIDVKGISKYLKFEKIENLKNLYIPKSIVNIPEYIFDDISGINIYFEHDSVETNLAHDMSKNTYHFNSEMPRVRTKVFGAPRAIKIENSYTLGTEQYPCQLRFKYVKGRDYQYLDIKNNNNRTIGSNNKEPIVTLEAFNIDSDKKIDIASLAMTNIFTNGNDEPLLLKVKVMEAVDE